MQKKTKPNKAKPLEKYSLRLGIAVIDFEAENDAEALRTARTILSFKGIAHQNIALLRGEYCNAVVGRFRVEFRPEEFKA